MAVIAACQFALWWVLWTAGFAKPPMLRAYSVVSLLGLSAGATIFLLCYLLRIYGEGERRPIKRIRQDIRPGIGLPVVAVTVLGPMMGSAFTAAKAALSFAVPFYLDLPLAKFERAVFGEDAWTISQSMLGWATPLIDRVYLTWLGVMLVAFNVLLLSKPSAFKTRAMIAYLLIWPIVGTAGGYALSSAGPIFHHVLFGGSAFANLIPTLEHEGASGTLFAYRHLLQAYSTRDPALGAGISAMPSVHVAMACWLALTIRERFPRFQWAGWVYFGLIWIGSIHLGWHYASDGLVGTIGAMAVWFLAPNLAFRTNSTSSLPARSFAE